jgi:hypothetical protein
MAGVGRLRPVEANGVFTLAVSLALQTSGEVRSTEAQLSVLGRRLRSTPWRPVPCAPFEPPRATCRTYRGASAPRRPIIHLLLARLVHFLWRDQNDRLHGRGAGLVYGERDGGGAAASVTEAARSTSSARWVRRSSSAPTNTAKSRAGSRNGSTRSLSRTCTPTRSVRPWLAIS